LRDDPNFKTHWVNFESEELVKRLRIRALLFRHSLPFTNGFIYKAGQGIESDGGSNSGKSGCKAGTFEGFLYHNGVIGCKLYANTIA
jgi:hypothetical protein